MLLMAGACSDSKTELINETSSNVHSEEKILQNVNSFTVKEGETLRLESPKLYLSIKQLQDNRCPADAICISAGEVSLTLDIRSEENAAEAKGISFCKGCPDETDSVELELDKRKYLMILEDVKPFPFSSQPETMKEKTAEFSIHPAP